MEFRQDIQRKKREEVRRTANAIQNRGRRIYTSATRGQRATGAVRNLSFDHPSTSSSTSTFYSSRSSHQDNFQWKPGQALPSPSIQPYIYAPDTPDDARNRDTHDGGSSEVLDYLHSLQNSLDSKLQTVCAKLEDIDSRMTSIETRQTSLEEEVRQSVSSSSSASPCFESDKRRKRVTPVLLQNQIRTVYNSFDEDSQFKLEEPITSGHNQEVVKKVVEAIEGYDSDLIKKGCRTYKKTIAARVKQSSTPIKKQKLARSLKQRAYERRARVVRPGKEATYWADVTADMMSDEERVGDKYIQHTPSYRSDKLNSFIKTLDKRAGKKGKSHARFHREQGSPRKQPIPQNAKPWMVKKHQEARDDLDVHSGEELDDDENSDMDGELFTSGEESGSSVVY